VSILEWPCAWKLSMIGVMLSTVENGDGRQRG